MTGFVYKNTGHAGKITSIVFTLPLLEISAGGFGVSANQKDKLNGAATFHEHQDIVSVVPVIILGYREFDGSERLANR